jgi:RNA polymerase sigma-70 factor (ECF subfamily)
MVMLEPSLHTRPSLLVRLRDNDDREAWHCFAEAYAPLVHGFLRRQGMQEADALDVAQDVLVAVAADIRRFEHRGHNGSFRGWLFAIVRNRAADYWRRERRHPRGSGESDVKQLLAEVEADGEAVEQRWNREFHENLFHAAASQVKDDFQDSTWDAFWRTTVDQESPQAVADDLGLSVAAVYMAKRRALLRIREQVKYLQGDMT